MTTWNRRIRSAILTFIVATSGVCGSPARAQSAGEKNYKKNCTPCHGVDGYANTPAGKQLKARDFHSPEVQQETDETLAAVIAKGKKNMPSFEKQLKPNEILDLVKYIRTFAKK
jgi:mono/diheme cytochrome c family protein